MTADRTSTADTGAEDLDGTPAPERRTPPDTPGAADVPSRADSRAGAAAANDTADSHSGAETDEDRSDTASPSAESAGERDVVDSESDPSVQASNEVNEQPAAGPRDDQAEAAPGDAADVGELGRRADGPASPVGAVEATENGSDNATPPGDTAESVNAGQDETPVEKPSTGGETADVDPVEDEAVEPVETPPADIETPRDAVEVSHGPRRDAGQVPEDDEPAEEPIEAAVSVCKGQDKTASSSGTSTSTDRRSPAEFSESPPNSGADQHTDTGRQAADTEAPATDAGPVIGDDGTWDWKGLRLDPEANHAADLAYAERRIAEGRDEAGNYAEHGITPAMRRIVGELEHGELVGCPEFSLKSEERFKEKLAKKISESPGLPAREVAGRIHDGIRYTFTFDSERYTAAIHDTRRRLEAAGYSLEFQRPTWGDPDYKGVNSRWRDPGSGQLFEVQFHTPQSWDAKQATHDAYEKMAAPTTPPEEVARLQSYQREITASVAIPPGALEIPYYEKED